MLTLILAVSFLLQWQPSVGEPGWPVEYIVTRNADTIGVTPDTTFTDTAPQPGQWNEYRVAARYTGRPEQPPSPWSNAAYSYPLDWTQGETVTVLDYNYLGPDSLRLAAAWLYDVTEPWDVTWLESADSFAVTAVCPWDFDGDGRVSLLDLSVFADGYGFTWNLSHFSGLAVAYLRPSWYAAQGVMP